MLDLESSAAYWIWHPKPNVGFGVLSDILDMAPKDTCWIWSLGYDVQNHVLDLKSQGTCWILNEVQSDMLDMRSIVTCLI